MCFFLYSPFKNGRKYFKDVDDKNHIIKNVQIPPSFVLFISCNVKCVDFVPFDLFIVVTILQEARTSGENVHCLFVLFKSEFFVNQYYAGSSVLT